MNDKVLPPYVFSDLPKNSSLFQGDILKVDSKLRECFKEFYPGITLSDGEIEFVMVLTQSCDLVKTEKRKPKLSHINVCLVRSIRGVIRRLLANEVKPLTIGTKKLLARDELDQLKDTISKLLNNTAQKALFFLPSIKPFVEDMTALLSLSFSFRVEHYDKLLENKVLELKPEFQAKVGHIIGQLYCRIGTPDLHDAGWNDKQIRSYINQLLETSNLEQVPDKTYMNYIQKYADDGEINIKTLEQEFTAIKTKELFQPIQNELLQNIKKYLMQLFDDTEKINMLVISDKKRRAQEITSILKQATQN